MKKTTRSTKKSEAVFILGQPKVTNSTNILDIKVPPQLEKSVKTGHKCVDAFFAGDGVTPSTAAIITGIPGAGKTTLMLQLADQITASGNIALYNTGEESLYQVRKTCKRLGLQAGFVPSYESTVQGILKKACELQKEHPNKQVFLFVDSLQCVEYERESGTRGRPPAPGNNEVKVVQALTAWAKETYGVVFIIGMVTKSGVFAGKQAIKHVVDAHLSLDIDTDRKSETYGQRVATMEKNRFGIAGVGYQYEVTANGVQFDFSN